MNKLVFGVLSVAMFVLNSVSFSVCAYVREINVAVIGDSGVGKTTLISAFCNCSEAVAAKVAPAIDKTAVFLNYLFEGSCERCNININFFDVHEQLEEMENPVNTGIFSECDYTLIVFDLNEGGTLEKGRIQRWTRVVKKENFNCGVYYVPNKIDLLNQERLNELAQPIARFAGQCDVERGRNYPNTLQDYSCGTVSAKERVGIDKLLN
ncbi:MAG: hypothetical protein LBK29_04800 [Oscillospiraceae bacterium]|nr:hypothetical protein [Oscillospiraceae bacterium]